MWGISTSSTYKRIASSRNAAADYEHVEINYTEDTQLTPGTYFIKNTWQNKALDSVMPEAGYTAGRTNVWGFGGATNQQWKVTKNTDGTYGLSPVSRPGFYQEVYQQIDTNAQPVTNYSHSPTSNAAKWRIIRIGNSETFRIMPVFSATRSLDVYSGTNTTMVFSGRSFPKRDGIDVQIATYTAAARQKWVFEASVDCIVSKEETKTITWLVLSGAGAGTHTKIITQRTSSEYTVYASTNSRKATKITQFAKIDKTLNPLQPTLSTGGVQLNNNPISIVNTPSVWVSPDWIWFCKEGYPNINIPQASNIQTRAIATMSQALYPYQDITSNINF